MKIKHPKSFKKVELNSEYSCTDLDRGTAGPNPPSVKSQVILVLIGNKRDSTLWKILDSSEALENYSNQPTSVMPANTRVGCFYD